jgi:hypothetical protein
VTSRTRFIGAVEIGTSKITALVGEFTGRELAIIGYGECQSRGVIKGTVVDYKAASECTHSALEAAEQSAGEHVDYVFLAQTGSHLEGFYNEAAVNVKSADNMVSRSTSTPSAASPPPRSCPRPHGGAQHPPPVPASTAAWCRAAPNTSWASASRSATGSCTARRTSWPTTST